MTTTTSERNRAVKPVTEYGPLVVFFGAYVLFDLITATAALMIATAAALALSYAVSRRVPLMPLITAGVVGVFGGLTLWLNDETFIKLKPTIVQGLIAAVLLGGLAFRRTFLKPVLGAAWQMNDEGWRRLTFRFGIFFVAMALLNEAVEMAYPEHRFLGKLQGVRHHGADLPVHSDPAAVAEPPSHRHPRFRSRRKRELIGAEFVLFPPAHRRRTDHRSSHVHPDRAACAN